MRNDQVAVFIASSDNTFDVLQVVYPSISRCWSDVRLPFFVGLNERILPERDVTTLHAAVGGWRKEIAAQLTQVASERVILLLDDFLFLDKVDPMCLRAAIEEAEKSDIAYMRLVPPDGSYLCRWRSALRDDGQSLAYEIPDTQPYFSSLQAALWKTQYLLDCLNKPGSIWDFEHQIDPGVRHHAVRRPVLSYKHVVEKGRWLAEAPELFRQSSLSFVSGARPLWPKSTILKRKLQRLRFELIGYGGMRLRRYFRNSFKRG